MRGKIKFFKKDRGYGFIDGDDGGSYFFHISEIDEKDVVMLDQELVEVDFIATKNKRGVAAIAIKIVK
jgi:CspA family cold shock protein